MMRNKLFHDLKKKNIALLQETDSKLEDENVWKHEWGGEIVFSHGSSSSRGACIMFAPNMDLAITDKFIDQQGRFVIINLTINDVNLTLANIYGPNNDNDGFLWMFLKTSN